MESAQPWQIILGAAVSVLGIWLTYRGATITANRAREGSNRTADVNEQQSALTAWQAMATEMVEPIRAELRESRLDNSELRRELVEERKARLARERRDDEDRAAAKLLVTEKINALQAQVDKLVGEVRVWKRVAQTIARWATLLRDEVLRLGGTVPATPEELLTLQAIEDSEQP